MEGYNFLCVTNVATLSNKHYFWARNCNGLFTFDKMSYKCDLVFQDNSKEYQNDKQLYWSCIRSSNGKLYIAPYYASNIIIYDPNTGMTDYIPIDTNLYFTDALFWEGWIYFFGGKEIIRIDTNIDKIEEIPVQDNMNAGFVCNNGKNVYITSERNDEIICFDMESLKMSNIGIGSLNMKFSTLSRWNDSLILSGDSDRIVSWNLNKQSLTTYDISNLRSNRKGVIDKTPFCKSDVVGDCIVFSPAKSDVAMAFDCKTKEWKELFQLIDNERSAYFVEIDENDCFFVCDYVKPDYEPSRILKMESGMRFAEVDAFILPGDVGLKFSGISETKIHNLSRFISNLTKTAKT